MFCVSSVGIASGVVTGDTEAPVASVDIVEVVTTKPIKAEVVTVDTAEPVKTEGIVEVFTITSVKKIVEVGDIKSLVISRVIDKVVIGPLSRDKCAFVIAKSIEDVGQSSFSRWN